MALAVPPGGGPPPDAATAPGPPLPAPRPDPAAPPRRARKPAPPAAPDLTVVVVNFCQWRNTARLVVQLLTGARLACDGRHRVRRAPGRGQHRQRRCDEQQGRPRGATSARQATDRGRAVRQATSSQLFGGAVARGSR